MLADFGAEVVKVEAPLAGAPARQWGRSPRTGLPPRPEACFLYLNTNKKSITLDLTPATGVEIVRRLVEESDVLPEDYAPGPLMPVVDRVFALSEAAAAHRYLASRAALGKVLLRP